MSSGKDQEWRGEGGKNPVNSEITFTIFYSYFNINAEACKMDLGRKSYTLKIIFKDWYCHQKLYCFQQHCQVIDHLEDIGSIPLCLSHCLPVKGTFNMQVLHCLQHCWEWVRSEHLRKMTSSMHSTYSHCWYEMTWNLKPVHIALLHYWVMFQAKKKNVATVFRDLKS